MYRVGRRGVILALVSLGWYRAFWMNVGEELVSSWL